METTVEKEILEFLKKEGRKDERNEARQKPGQQVQNILTQKANNAQQKDIKAAIQ